MHHDELILNEIFLVEKNLFKSEIFPVNKVFLVWDKNESLNC